MSFREKSAWISFVLILVLAVVYFGKIAAEMRFHSRDWPLLFPTLVGAVIALEIALHLALRVRAPGEARTPRDEREKMIALKAKSVSYPVLAVAAFSALGTVHLGATKWDLVQAVLFAIIVGELSKFGAEIVYFRRGV